MMTLFIAITDIFCILLTTSVPCSVGT